MASAVILLSTSTVTFASLPAVKALTGTPITPADANTWYYSHGNDTHTNGLCALRSEMCGLARPGAIIALARTLSRGGTLTSDQLATNVYEYIYKNIDTEFRYGLSKGAYGALLDQSGTPFDQAHLMAEILKEAAADYPSNTSYSQLAPTYEAGTVTFSGAEFSAWTGITNAQAACQFLANGGIPASVNGQTPQYCSSVTGNVTSIVMSHIWLQATTTAGTKLYDPSYKTYIQKAPIALSTVMGCGANCGSNATSQAIPAASHGTETLGSSSVPWVQNVQDDALGTTLNGYASTLQHYIEQHMPAASVADIAGGQTIDPSSMPSPSASLPYDSAPVPQHSWTGDIPNQFRSRLKIQVNTINVWLYADETYGYWLYMTGSENNAQPIEYTTLFFEREKGTTAPNTPNLVALCTVGSPNCTAVSSGGLRPTNEVVPLVSTTITSTSSVSLQADHPYAASSTGGTPDGTYADDSRSQWKIAASVTLPNASNQFGYLIEGATFYITQSWGRMGRGMVARMSKMADQKKDMVNGAARWVQGSALPIPNTSLGFFQDLLRNLTLPIASTTWLAEAGKATAIIDGMSGTRTQEHHTLGVLLDMGGAGPFAPIGLAPIGGAIQMDAVGAMSITSVTSNAADVQSAFAVAATAYDALEGSSLEQLNDAPDGGNAIRLFQINNETAAMRYYQATPTNVADVLTAAQGYTLDACGPQGGDPDCGPESVQAFLYAGSPFTVIVPKVNGWWVQSQNTHNALQYPNSPFLAYAANNAISYLSTYGTKGATVTSPSPDPVSAAIDTTHKMAPVKPIDITVDNSEGSLTASLPPDIVTGPGTFPSSLSHRLFYNSGQIANVQCRETHSQTYYYWYNGIQEPYTTFINNCWTPVERRTMLGWNDNYQIDAAFANDGMRGLGQDSALDASAAIASLYVLRDLNKSPSFLNYVTTMFTAAWLQDNLSANAVVVNRPPSSDTFVRLPDGRFNPRSGTWGSVTQTGTRTKDIGGGGPLGNWMYYYGQIQLSETDADGNVLLFSVNDQTPNSLFPSYNRFKPDTWTFANGLKLNFSYTSMIDPLNSGHQLSILSGVSNSLGRSLTFNGTTITDDSQRSATVSILGPTSGQVTPPDGKQTLLSFDRPDNYSDMGTTRLSAVYLPLDHANPYLSFGWDGLRRISTVTDGRHNSRTYFPASIGSREANVQGQVVDALGNATVQYFDDRGHVLTLTDALGNTTTSAYDSTGRLTQTTYPEGNYDTFSYDGRSNLLSKTKHAKPGCTPADQCADIVSSTTYMEGPSVFICTHMETCNKPSYETNPKAYKTQYCWATDGTGLLQRTIKGLTAIISCTATNTTNPETDFTYLPHTANSATFYLLDTTTSIIDASTSVSAKLGYETLTNKFVPKTSTVDPGGLNLITNVTFDASGNLATINGPRTDLTTDVSNFTWDQNRRPLLAIQPAAGGHDAVATRYTYDDNGRLQYEDEGTAVPNGTSWTFTPLMTTSYYYDAAGNLTKQTTPTTLKQFSYDADNRPYCTAVRMNRDSSNNFVPKGDVCAPSTITTYGPDQITLNTYDADGRLYQESRFLSAGHWEQYATYDYWPNGTVKTVYDAMGSTHLTSYAYDGFDRLSQTTFAYPAIYEHLVYDADSNITKRDHGSPWPETRYTYDALDRVTTKAYDAVTNVSAANTVTWNYDLASRVTSISDLLNNVLVDCYDLAGRLTAETASTDRTVGVCGSHYNLGKTRTVSYKWDGAGNRTRITWPDSAYYVSYGFDAANRMVAACEKGTYTTSSGTCSGTPATTLATFDYDQLGSPSYIRYWASGTMEATVATGFSTEGDLNSLAHTFLDSNSISYANLFSPAHQITSAATTTTNAGYNYVPVSNTDTYPTASIVNAYEGDVVHNGGSTHLEYDGHFNLKLAGPWVYAFDPEDRLTTASGPPGSVTYTYDPLDRRTSKSGTAVTNALSFLSSGTDEIAEYTKDTASLQNRFIPGPTVDHPIAMISGGTKEFFHQDKTGSVVAMSGADGRLVEGPFTYDGFGNGPPTTGVPFKFTGRRLDPETGLYYYRARYYSSALGRFISADPLGYKADLNMFAYAGNDPTDRTDPTGMYDFQCLGDNCTQEQAEFEEERQADLQSPFSDVVDAAKAWGDPGDGNGITVSFEGQHDLDKEAGSKGTDALIPAGQMGLNGDRVVAQIHVSKDLTPREMKRMIAHEGSHFEDAQKFANTYDPKTKKYSAQADYTRRQTETKAFQIGNKIKPYGYRSPQELQRDITKAFGKGADALVWPERYTTAPGEH